MLHTVQANSLQPRHSLLPPPPPPASHPHVPSVCPLPAPAAMSNLCRDESCMILEDKIESVFGSCFSTHGLGGVLTCGVIGMGAGLSHSPVENVSVRCAPGSPASMAAPALPVLSGVEPLCQHACLLSRPLPPFNKHHHTHRTHNHTAPPRPRRRSFLHHPTGQGALCVLLLPPHCH